MSSAAELIPTRSSGVDQGSFRVARWLIQMSVAPSPPGRLEPNQSVRPSVEIALLVSNASVFTPSTSTGVPNGSLIVARLATQMSPSPGPPSRLEVK
jgi:hypothetical protein